MTLDQKILELVKKYMGKLAQKKVLTSMEEVEANTNETNLVAAPVVAELNNKLGGFEPICDSTGEITGYKTDVGGADTVFPFIKRLSGNFRLNSNNTYFTIENVKNYKALSLWNGGATDWVCSRIAIYGDGALLGEITTESKTFDITHYSTIKIYGKYVRGDGNSNYVWGNYSLK